MPVPVYPQAAVQGVDAPDQLKAPGARHALPGPNTYHLTAAARRTTSHRRPGGCPIASKKALVRPILTDRGASPGLQKRSRPVV